MDHAVPVVVLAVVKRSLAINGPSLEQDLGGVFSAEVGTKGHLEDPPEEH